MTRIVARMSGVVRRAPMFDGPANLTATTVLGALAAYFGYRFFRWAVVDAIWTLPAAGGSSLCRSTQGGACWAVIHERFRFVLFGLYPFEEQWRPALVSALFVLLYVVSAIPTCWKRWLIGCWIAVPTTAVLLLRGGLAGLSAVPTESWGGLPLTLVLSTVGFVAAFPVAIVLALGRRSARPAIRALSVAYIELVRGIPVVTFLFMAAVMFPLFVPQGLTVDKLLRAQLALVIVMAAYVAEVVRAGLQAVPRSQYEAASSLGFSFVAATVLIVLPQALRATIPALVNTFIAFFKDTSLVTVIGLFDLLGAAKAVIIDPKWVGFGVEVYLFVAALYFAFCYAVSQYTQRLERMLVVRSRQ